MAPNLTDDQVVTALQSFLCAITGLPADNVLVSQQNRAPMPLGDFIYMTPAHRDQLATTTHSYDKADGLNRIGRSNALAYQLDIYGDNATDNAQVIATLFRDSFGCDFLAPFGIQPLYCDKGHQMPLVTGEAQYLNRWTLTATLQANPTISTPTEFADSVQVTMVEIG